MVSVYMLLSVCHNFVKVWKVAADNSYVWLHLPHVKVNGCEMYLCVCYVVPRSSTVNADNCPYDALQLDIAEAQNAGRVHCCVW